MNNPIQLREKIFSPSHKNVSEEDLAKIVEQYPYFAIAQFYLLQQYKKVNPNLFEKQGAKTALFFSNTNWLKWQLHLLNESELKDKPLHEPVAETKIETTSVHQNEDIIAFEPLHTVDYFASQGIKITDEPVTTDKLGKQMKSFTEWLKSMKKIHTEKVPAADDQTDKKIQSIAEDSNANAEVLTEAMAEVLIKQGKPEKAVELYEKLSLINPSKSAYFADKIKSLSADGQV